MRFTHAALGLCCAAGLALPLAAMPALSASATTAAPGSSAEAYGAYVGAHLLAGNVPVSVPPVAEASEDYPPGGAPQTGSVVQLGPAPSDGSLVQNVGVIQSAAIATPGPAASATASAANVALLSQAGVPLVTADLVRSESTSTCTADPSAAGSELVNLKVAGQPVSASTPPNTTIPLGLLTVVINEQHPAADGRGLVVNAIHVYSTSAGSGLFAGDIVIAHAMSTVACPNGAASTGSKSAIVMHKTATPTEVHPGDTVTYTATITNSSTSPCVVNQFVDHLPQAFSFGSTSGALGSTATTAARPGGGSDAIITPSPAVTIGAGKSVQQTFTLTVKPTAVPGVYYNNLELFCSDLGNFVKGLDAPVQVLAAPAPAATPASGPNVETPAAGSPQLPLTGGNPALAIGGAVLAAGALILSRHARRRKVA